MTRRLSLILLALLAVASTACGRYLTTGIAVVNGTSLDRDQFDKQVASVFTNPQFQGAVDPQDADQRLQIERQVIIQMIQDELIRQEAERLDINVTSQEVDARFQAIAAAQPTELQQEVDARGLTAVRTLIKGQMLAEGIAEKAAGNTPPTEAEIAAAYGNGQRFEEILLRHILFQVQPGADETAARTKA
ncbi:MAG: SurA N-terminal domain-containing protein, partial [Actinomycetota bacterium]